MQQTTGATAVELMGDNAQSYSSVTYSRRGVIAAVSSSYGVLMQQMTYAADGLVTEIQYGDGAHTTTTLSYDARRRIHTAQTYRAIPTLWSSPPQAYLPSPTPTGAPSSFQLLLQDDEVTYDLVNHPVELRDWRIASEWPAGAKPVHKRIEYDNLYRVKRIDYDHVGGGDSWLNPFEAEDDGIGADPRRATPSPRVSFDRRTHWQSFAYDWLGNTVGTDDDAHGFYDRSLGKVANNVSGGKPYQLQFASQSRSTRGGSLSTRYDAAGNLVDMAVTRKGPCLPAGAACSHRFLYDFDEVGNLSRARRWDQQNPSTGEPPLDPPSADLKYEYGAGGTRARKTAFDQDGIPKHTLYIFGTLELRRAEYTEHATGSDYEDTKNTEVVYVAGARLHYDEEAVPMLGGASLHVFLRLGDHLGSSSRVVDKATGELVEASTYLGYGTPDSNYRPARWNRFRDDYRFTGKEEDSEVGLTYFGARYLSSHLGRWISADPLTIHQAGADLNAYAYVHGALLSAVDPLGLDSRDEGFGVNAGGQGYRVFETGEDGKGNFWWDQERFAPVQNEKTAIAGGFDAAKMSLVGAAKSGAEGIMLMLNPGIGAVLLIHDIAGDIKTNLEEGNSVAGSVGKTFLNKSPIGFVKTVVEEVTTVYNKATDDKSTSDYEFGKAATNLAITAAQFIAAPKAGGGGRTAVSKAATVAEKVESLADCVLCLAKGTMIHTVLGLKPVEQIEPGDIVLAEDEATMGLGWKAVEQTFVIPGRPILDIVVTSEQAGEETLRATPNHPFWVDGNTTDRPDEDRPWPATWVTADELRVGDVLRTPRGPAVVVRLAFTGEQETTYNFEVAGWHTYFAGVAGVLVHNACTRSVLPLGLAPIEEHMIRISQAIGQTLGRRGTVGMGEVGAGAGRRQFVVGTNQAWANQGAQNALRTRVNEVQAALGIDITIVPPEYLLTDAEPNIVRFSQRELGADNGSIVASGGACIWCQTWFDFDHTIGGTVPGNNISRFRLPWRDPTIPYPGMSTHITWDGPYRTDLFPRH